MSTHAPPRIRGPRLIACVRCRQRKKRCDKHRPVCGECARSGAECVPLAAKKIGRGQLSVQYMHLLEDHVASLETRLRSSNPSIADDHLGSLSPGDMLLPTPDGMHTAVDTMYGDLMDDADLLLSLSPPPQPVPLRPGAPRPYDMLVEPEPVLDRLSCRLAAARLSATVTGRYVTEYFVSVHPMWPFLHHQQWQVWWQCWKEKGACDERDVDDANEMALPEEAHRPALGAFFVDMVLAIGSLLVHDAQLATDDDGGDRERRASSAAYGRALALYQTDALAKAPPVLRTQAALLLTLYAMHAGTADAVFAHAAQAMATCLQTDGVGGSGGGLNTIIRKMVLRTCVVIDILISNTMDPGGLPRGLAAASVSIETADGLEDDDASVSAEELRLALPLDGEELLCMPSCPPPSAEDVALEEHLFRLRRIQISVLRLVRRLEQDAHAHGHPVPNLWRSRPKYTLDQWVSDTDHLAAASASTARRQMRFKSAAWMRKLASYTVISLFPNPELAVRGGDARHLVAAACQVLNTFRKLRITEHVSCYTWTALLHQFQAGVIVVFCLWATPTHQQLTLYDRRAVCQALFACLGTLGDFAHKWSSAAVFREVFELLTDAVPVAEYGDPSQQWSISPLHAPRLVARVAELEALQVQGRVVAMLRRMLQARPLSTPATVEETRWIQYEHAEVEYC